MQKQFVSGLKVKNSLTEQLEDFKPTNGNTVKWYVSGPILEQAFTLTQARNFASQDLIRSVLARHFGYHVQVAMNISDVSQTPSKNPRQEARKLESEFINTIRQLEVEKPDYLIRVSEYIPEVIAYISKIMENGFGYIANGSVYFDTQVFDQKHVYGKMRNIHGAADTVESKQAEEGERKSDRDFVLWRAARGKEEKWDSPWGKGQPGWQIEGLAVVSNVLGHQFDICSGGIELLFPHHQNNLASATAFHEKNNQTNYLLHVGHLHQKQGAKAFPTVQQLLKEVGGRCLKLMFFQHRYDHPMNFDPTHSLEQAQHKDKKYKHFFGELRNQIRGESLSRPQKMTQEDKNFDGVLEAFREAVHEAFCDNINSNKVIAGVDEAIKHTHVYLQEKDRKAPLMEKAYRLIHTSLQVMGLTYQDTSQVGSTRTSNIITALTAFRDEVRINSKNNPQVILESCNRFRDEQLTQFNIAIDQTEGQPSQWRLLPQNQQK